MDGAPARRPTKDPWRFVLKVFTSQSALLYFALALCSPYIISGLVYMLLRSLLYAPNGFWPVLTLVIGVAGFCGSVALLISEMRRAKRRRREGIRQAPNPWHLPILGLSIPPCIAPTVVLVIRYEMQVPEAYVSKHGLVIRTPRDQLHDVLRNLEKRGIWTWFPSRRQK